MIEIKLDIRERFLNIPEALGEAALEHQHIKKIPTNPIVP